jgi:hypothetical protein
LPQTCGVTPCSSRTRSHLLVRGSSHLARLPLDKTRVCHLVSVPLRPLGASAASADSIGREHIGAKASKPRRHCWDGHTRSHGTHEGRGYWLRRPHEGTWQASLLARCVLRRCKGVSTGGGYGAAQSVVPCGAMLNNDDRHTERWSPPAGQYGWRDYFFSLIYIRYVNNAYRFNRVEGNRSLSRRTVRLGRRTCRRGGESVPIGSVATSR